MNEVVAEIKSKYDSEWVLIEDPQTNGVLWILGALFVVYMKRLIRANGIEGKPNFTFETGGTTSVALVHSAMMS